MWGQSWGQMFWGAPAPVPGVGVWGALLLGVALGALLVRKPRAWPYALLALGLLAPLSARAVSLISFQNGTVADANQVNANFAALTPVQGSDQATYSGTFGAIRSLMIPSFVTPRALKCVVHSEATLAVPFVAKEGVALFTSAVNQNGVPRYPTIGGSVSNASFQANVGQTDQLSAAQTRVIDLPANLPVAFGCELRLTGVFVNATSASCNIVYDCI